MIAEHLPGPKESSLILAGTAADAQVRVQQNLDKLGYKKDVQIAFRAGRHLTQDHILRLGWRNPAQALGVAIFSRLHSLCGWREPVLEDVGGAVARAAHEAEAVGQQGPGSAPGLCGA